jgi:hypothetical protein
MKKVLRFAFASLMLAATIAVCLQNAGAQQIVPLRPLHKFHFSFNQGYGALLTRDFNEGQNANMFYRGALFGGVFDNQQCGTVPLYRWRIQQSGRAYWYFTIGNHPAGSPGYYYEGIAGYVLPVGDSRGTPIYIWYSQRFGYYFTSTIDECKPDEYCGFPESGETTYRYHGIGWYNINGNAGGNTQWSCPPPPPPPTCNATQQQTCYANGGNWNSTTCKCTYPPPDPCRGGADLGGDKPDKGEGTDLAPMPCRSTEP